MKTYIYIKVCLIAMGMAAVFFFVDYVYSAWSGDPASLSKAAVILMIVFFACQIANKSDDQPPEEDPSD
jgi:hypothetical protein